jgi:predicted kinase
MKMREGKILNVIMTTPNQTTFVVWFVLGPIGAGKSTYIHKVLQSQPHLVYLSPDTLNLPYLEARSQMGKLIKDHTDRRVSIIVEGTGQHNDLYELFLEYIANREIELKITFIDIDLPSALERNKQRTRVLPDEIVKQVHKRCYERRSKWQEFGCVYVDYRDLTK